MVFRPKGLKRKDSEEKSDSVMSGDLALLVVGLVVRTHKMID
jgi:hypothetical protein